MRDGVEKLMFRYGTDMVLTGAGGTRIVRGFFRAVRSQSWQRTDVEAGTLGQVPRGQYVYLGPVSGAAREGDTVELDGESYLLRRVEPYYFGNETVYQWGLCVRKGKEEAWGL